MSRIPIRGLADILLAKTTQRHSRDQEGSSSKKRKIKEELVDDREFLAGFSDDESDYNVSPDLHADLASDDLTENLIGLQTDQAEVVDDNETTLLDLHDLRLLEQFQDPEEEDIIPTVPVDTIDEDDIETVISATVGYQPSFTAAPSTAVFDTVAGPSHVTAEATAAIQPPADFDDSTPVPNPRAAPTSDFEVALGLWCQEAGISRAQWTGLREILNMLSDDAVKKLPKALDTLKLHAVGQLPLLELRQTPIKLNIAKLPASRRKIIMSRALAAGQVATAPDNLFFFNPIYLFQAILSSTIRERMHIGMAHFVDEPAELWHSTAWASSIRYSSGEFPRLPEGQVVFPSDIVLYQCNEAICRCHTDADKNHIGRILSFGRDYRSQREHRGPIGSVVVEVQKIVPFIDLMDTRRDLLLMIIKLDPLPENKELVILEDDISMVLESALTPYTFNFDIFLDYAFESSVKLRDDKSHIQGQLFIRRIFRGDNIRPLNQSRAIRGQIEIAEYGRQYLVDKFSKSSNIISIPLLAFLDGFGLFRNMYRTIMGFYLLLAPLRSSDRNKRQNVFPLTLGPHGSNFTEVTDALRGRITQLERGIDMLITGKQFTVCVSVMAYIGDMPQQQTNSGFRSVAAESTCRMCLVETAQRGLLDFDIEARGRYHYEVIRQRASIRSRPNKIQRKITADKLGMEAEDPALMKLSPALDLVLSRPPDPFHSELNGITKLTHLLWNGDLLTKKAAAEY
ncbi:hypothetical protein P152DRAFT_431744, partial [Eremomyces bilateralis CBS 781.70]